MRLLSLQVSNFRNLETVEVAPSPHATVIVGENGQGKTNLLEAIYLLVTLRPLRASKLGELLRFGHAQSKVTARFELKGAQREVCVDVREKSRQPSVDGKRAASLEAYFGGVSAVAFTPDDLRVIKGSPEGRRTFLDRAVFNRFPAYLAESRAYGRALKSRNKLLKDRAPSSYLAAFDETLAKAGTRLYLRRRALVDELKEPFQRAFGNIGRTEAPARFTYAPAKLELDFAAATEASLMDALLGALTARIPRDYERGFTSVGPHVDDLDFSLGDTSAKAFASQGQQRALVLSWKIAEIENLQRATGFLPLLLLDDVSSELDPERNRFLMDYLAQSGAQVFLTTTDAVLVRKAALPDTVWYSVSRGKFTLAPELGNSADGAPDFP